MPSRDLPKADGAVRIATRQGPSVGGNGQSLVSPNFLYKGGVLQHVALRPAYRDAVVVGVGFNIGLWRNRHRQRLAALQQGKWSIVGPEIEQISRLGGIFLNQWEPAFARTGGGR